MNILTCLLVKICPSIAIFESYWHADYRIGNGRHRITISVTVLITTHTTRAG